MLKCRAVPVDQINAAVTVRCDIFNKTAQRFENVAERTAGCHHLQQSNLTCELRLGAFALVDVDEKVVPADDVPVRVPERKSARLKPAVDTIDTSRPDFELERVT